MPLLAALLALAAPIDPVKVFAIYEPVTSPHDVELVSRLAPDLVCRGWFKWSSSPQWANYAGFAQALAQKGIRVQGGITCAAIYPHENGIDDATFRDFTTHDPDGEPVKVAFGTGGWWHLSLYNPKVREYLKADVHRQIDAGACGIWYDEIEGTYDWLPRSGYDRYAVDAFKQWLIVECTQRRGWTKTDPRFKSELGIDLAQYGGSIDGFDYLRWLHETPGANGKPMAADPPQGDPRHWATSPNRLFRLWGFAWDRKAAGTFRFDTVQAMFAEIQQDARRYAREKYGRELIQTYNHNGVARPGVDFLQPHHGAQPFEVNGRLDGRRDYLSWFEQTLADAAPVAAATPMVFFVDWPGETDRMAALPRTDQIHFLRQAVAEAYAAGGEFALPARGYTYLSEAQDTLGCLCQMADWIREQHSLFRGSQPVAGAVEAPRGVVARLRRSPAGTVLHLINHNWDAVTVQPRPVVTGTVTIPEEPTAEGVFATSFEWLEQKPVAVERIGGRLSLKLPTFATSLTVVIPHGWRSLAGTAAAGSHVQLVDHRAAAVAGADGGWQVWLAAGTPEPRVACLETGQVLAEAAQMRFAAPALPARTAGVLLDAYGTPLKHRVLPAQPRPVVTDAWGRFCLAADGAATTWPGEGDVALKLAPGTAEYRLASLTTVLDAAKGPSGTWGNWAERDPNAPDPAVTVTRVQRGDRAAEVIGFAAKPVGWRNTNSPAFVANGEGIEIVYQGDGRDRSVNAGFQVFAGNFDPPRPGDTFYVCPVSLKPTGWTTLRLLYNRFAAPNGETFDRVANRRAAFQWSPSGAVTTPLTFAVARMALYASEPPVQVRRASATGTLDTFDALDLWRGHVAQERLKVPAGPHQALFGFDEPDAALPYCNWQGRDANGPTLLTGTLATPGHDGTGRCLKLVFAARQPGWANVNLPLPAGLLARTGGLVAWVRTNTDELPVRFALHLGPGARPGLDHDEFYTADALVAPGTWTQVAIPWNRFRNGETALVPAQVTAASLQVAKAGDATTEDTVVEVDGLATWPAP